MDISFPYARYVCPCSDDDDTPTFSKRASQIGKIEPEDGHNFNPHDPRASYSLYPLDYLLFCDDCNHTRCPKCWTEEMMFWYCPNCLFEVPSSGVKSDGNRCARHCYNCPLCTANLAVTAVHKPSDGYLKPEESSAHDSYVLRCQHCDYSSLDIGITFNKPTKITEQLNKLWKANTASSEEQDGEEVKKRGKQGTFEHEIAFVNLQKFYKDQLSESGDQQNAYSNSPYSSPANLARIMSLYGGLSYNALKKTREKPQPMREAGGYPEGLLSYTSDDTAEDEEVLQQMRTLGLGNTASESQRLAVPSNYEAKFIEQLWPVATPLRVRRGKRCRTCRQFLARPDSKVGTLRFRIKLLALNYIQRLSIRPLQAVGPLPSASFHLRPEPLAKVTLQPHQTHQYVLTVRNPVFEKVKISLATPTITPGRVASRVTILCPSFTIGAAGDVWEEALSSSSAGTTGDGSRRAAMASLTGSTEGDRQPEAGKVWERSRNSTSVVLEVVPGPLTSPPSIVPKWEQESVDEELAEDDDVLEIPIYVRAEWEAVPHDDGSAGFEARAGEKVSKELAYWCVLGVGRIAQV